MPSSARPASSAHPLERRTPRTSRVETAQLVLPGLTNVHGTIFGGILMQWIDIAAGIAAARHAGGPVVTASMDRLHFLDPVQLGEVVILQAQVNFAATTSMEVGVRVMCENQATFARRQTTRAYLTFVAVDEHGQPRPVPALHPETAVERRRVADAPRRRAVRLRERRAMKKG
ncbi:MAG TPA: hotdog domain-containing protein [Polyangia bacterium]|nr:hotdog domain-containing protein [Polyangia bacterium]